MSYMNTIMNAQMQLKKDMEVRSFWQLDPKTKIANLQQKICNDMKAIKELSEKETQMQ